MNNRSIAIRRVLCGLPVTNKELDELKEWIDERNRKNDQLVHFFIIVGIVAIVAGLAT